VRHNMARSNFCFANVPPEKVQEVCATILTLLISLGLIGTLGWVGTMAYLSKSRGAIPVLLAVLGGGTNILLCVGMWMIRLHMDHNHDRAQSEEPEVCCVWAVWSSCTFAKLKCSTSSFSRFRIQSGRSPTATLHITDCGNVALLVGKIAQVHDDDACYCCLDGFEPQCRVALLPCGHVFHEMCIATWCLCDTPNASTCPVCRSRYDVSHTRTSSALL